MCDAYLCIGIGFGVDEYVFMFRVGVVFELVLGFKSVGFISIGLGYSVYISRV